MTTKLTIEEISQLILEYYQSDAKLHQRLGQYFCNKYNVTDSDLFYCPDKSNCISMMVERYSDNK